MGALYALLRVVGSQSFEPHVVMASALAEETMPSESVLIVIKRYPEASHFAGY